MSKPLTDHLAKAVRQLREQQRIAADPGAAVAELRATRNEIRRHGLRPPPLPVEP